MFWIKFSELCKSKGLSPTKALNETGIPTSIIPKWKDGASPRISTKRKITDHFGLPEDYFDEKNPTAKDGEGLTDQESALLELFRSTDVVTKSQIVAEVKKMVTEAEKKALKPDKSAIG